MKKTSLYIGATGLVAAAVLVAVPVFAASHYKNMGSMPRPAIIGTVTAISGTTLTVVAMLPRMLHASTTPATAPYTVNASGATITSGFGSTTATITLSGVPVNSHVVVSGTVSGTSITATKIELLPAMLAGTRKPGPMMGRMGTGTMPGKMMGWKPDEGHVAVGAVTAINGSQFTITSKMPKEATTTETIVTTNATTFKENGQSATLGSVAVGNFVMATGTTTAPSVFAANTVRIMTPRVKTGAHK